ncbi:HEPN domain-containing protein [Methanobacterium sp. MBAC-LM]|uniref:HEPN domain-containing protein n=1 Tax=Methanobacterium sp. MBAC-LM TaxID=3412034 RepID=UPI003C74AD6D
MNDLENCFNRGLLRPVEPSKEKGELSIKQAREWLEEAKRNLENEAYRSAQISTYLALFHSARAILFRDGIREKS